MFKKADYQQLWKAVTSGFNSIPDLMRFVTPELIESESKKIVEQLDGIPHQDQIQKGQELAQIRAAKIYGFYRDEEMRLQRVEERKQRKEQEEQETQERARIAEVGRQELDQVIAKIMVESDHSLSVAQREALKYFKLIYVENKRDPEISYLFPNTSRDQRYQWKTRAIKMIAPMVSEEAKKYISERSKTKFATNELLQAVDEYLKACLKG